MGRYNRSPRSYIAPIVAVCLLAVLCMAIFTALTLLTDLHPATLGTVTVVVYAVICAIGIALYFIITSRKQRFHAVDDSASDLECNLTLNMLADLYMPVALVNPQNKIIWYNESFEKKASVRGTLYGKSFSDYCPATTSDLLACDKPKGMTVEALGEYYNVKAHKLPFDGENMVLTMWNNCTRALG